MLSKLEASSTPPALPSSTEFNDSTPDFRAEHLAAISDCAIVRIPTHIHAESSYYENKNTMSGTVRERPENEGGSGNVALTFREMFRTEMVDLYVGPGKEHFRVHKTALCGKVPYFDKMFNGGFSEASKSTATFPEDDAETFDLLLRWVYQVDLEAPQILKPKREGEVFPLSWSPLKLYQLAEKLCIQHLQDEVVDIFRELDKTSDSLSVANTFLNIGIHMSQSGGLYRYLAHCFAFMIVDGDICDTCQIDGEVGIASVMIKDIVLTRDVLNILRAGGGKVRDPFEVPDCIFHCHAKGEPCYKDK